MAITVSYSEMQGSPVEGLDRDGAKTAIRRLLCDWTDRWTLMAEIINEDYENETGTRMICAGASSDSFPAANIGSTTVAAYEKAIVTANYQIVISTVGGVGPSGDETVESIEPWAEFLTVGVANLKWTNAVGADLTDDQKPGKLMTGLTYVFRKTFQEVIPKSVRDLIGKVNAKTTYSTSEGMEEFIKFEPQTLLFQTPTITRTIDEVGELTWDVEYRLMYKPNWDGTTARGWNYYWNQDKAGGAGFDLIWDVKAAAQYLQYPTGDFTTI